MKKVWTILVPVLALWTVAAAENGGPPLVDNDIATNQNQSASASGGDSRSDSASNANVNMNTTSVSNYQTRTPPLTTFPPYLPYWQHGGWGTIKAYFPNGPTANDQVYETTFDPRDPSDMREIRSVLQALPHAGLLPAVGGALNNVAVALFGAPDMYFHGRGIEIADSIVRDRRPENKSLLVFIDSNVDMNLLVEEGYAYMGKVSVEADPDRNWDQAYKAAVAEALLWDVDILLISGGMKGVTTGSNTTFPTAGVGYSQMNYSMSLLGGKAKGITEGQGKAILSAEAYRYSPERIERRRIPAAIYDRIRCRPWPTEAEDVAPAPAPVETVEPSRAETWEPAGEPALEAARVSRALTPQPESGTVSSARSPRFAVGEPAYSAPALRTCPPAAPPRNLTAPVLSAPTCAPEAAPSSAPAPTPARRSESRPASHNRPGITVSQELFEKAGFPNDQQVGYVQVK